ncbi:hypothetical protein [Shewanella sp. GXUN23E]|uniref:hypothetical protein n=1 Tax=Shewanella sp. GXUN23E TaxID=3422498 RepID=UPI003D7E6D65
MKLVLSPQMIPISQVLPLVDKHLKHMAANEAVRFKTYKKDRSILIYCRAMGEFSLIEQGFHHHTCTGDRHSILKQTKKALQREFPRSNTAWVEYFEQVDDPFNLTSAHNRQASLFD